MRKLILLLSGIFVCNILSAQTVDFSKVRKGMKADSIAKKIVDKADYVVTYTYSFARDAKFPNEKRNSLTVLQVGDKYNRFIDYYRLCYDSLMDETAKKHLSIVESGAKLLLMMRKAQFDEGILIDKQTNKETIQKKFMAKNFQYEENCPSLKWDLQQGDTLIAGYHCNKATTTLFGRNYIAWYSPDVNMPYGPYKFNGLPGLVFKVTDTAGNFDFTLCGLEKATRHIPVYKWSKADIIKTTREKVRKIYKNYCADPTIALNGMEGVSVSDDTKARVKSKPYNPIELE